MCSSIAFLKAGEKPQQPTNLAWDWKPLADLGRKLRFPDNTAVTTLGFPVRNNVVMTNFTE